MSVVLGAALAVIIPPASTYLLLGSQFKGWQLILLLICFPGFLLAFAIFLIAEPRRQHSGTGAEIGYAAFFRYVAAHRRMVLSTYAGAVCYIAATTAILSWSPVFL